ncbi:hypothetical protein FOA52_010067 [Chlamydomonas sp. UWO 241]|nr:hypothetical protein FOA52_010067 [Chlamydomonas sp. UWO 241]
MAEGKRNRWGKKRGYKIHLEKYVHQAVADEFLPGGHSWTSQQLEEPVRITNLLDVATAAWLAAATSTPALPSGTTVRDVPEEWSRGFKMLTYMQWMAGSDSEPPALLSSGLNSTARITAPARFKMGLHELQMERGRYAVAGQRQRRTQRACCLCGGLEDEAHMVFEFPAYEEARVVTKRKDNEYFACTLYKGSHPYTPVLDFMDFVDGEYVKGQDIVIWATIGNNHLPTSEDAPSTNVNTGYGGLWLKPHNYFDEDHTRDLRETTLYTTDPAYMAAAAPGTTIAKLPVLKAVKLLEGPSMSPNAIAGMALLLELVRERLPQMQPQALANTLWALSKLEVGDPAFVSALLNETRPKLSSFNAQDLTNAAYAMAKLGLENVAFMGALLDAASTKLSSFNEQNLANILWATAEMGHEDKNFVRLLLVEAKPKLASFTEQALANTAWALATLGHKDAAFMGAMLVSAGAKLPSFKSQELANTAWALATLGHKDAVFMGAMLGSAGAKMPSFTAQQLAIMAWALPTLGYLDTAFMPSWDSQALANTALVLATLGYHDAAFMGALLMASAPKLPSFTAQELVTMAWALSALGHKNPAFQSALLSATKHLLPSSTLADATQMAIVLAKTRVKDADFLRALKARRDQLSGGK